MLPYIVAQLPPFQYSLPALKYFESVRSEIADRIMILFVSQRYVNIWVIFAKGLDTIRYLKANSIINSCCSSCNEIAALVDGVLVDSIESSLYI